MNLQFCADNNDNNNSNKIIITITTTTNHQKLEKQSKPVYFSFSKASFWRTKMKAVCTTSMLLTSKREKQYNL